eukprot:CAMPEP_0174261802 /NCGR_PEP_ID=MMETSP0439-20130205/12246_1 /TAXON_ID=0 /ORGANISM="Stereomyxa ramosa, Strain Chinc5" /LENGTH=198 /DNA_ID=CAMNT_0015346373 /DNA_START=12 /DNA_END=608 /DNA_ORIENTATION=+
MRSFARRLPRTNSIFASSRFGSVPFVSTNARFYGAQQDASKHEADDEHGDDAWSASVFDKFKAEEQKKVDDLLATLPEHQRTERVLNELNAKAEENVNLRMEYEAWKRNTAINTDIEELFGEKGEEFWNDPDNWDPHDYVWKLKVDRLCRILEVPEAEQPKFRKENDISQGYMTLEWIHPSPPPLHTYEELPIIKEAH